MSQKPYRRLQFSSSTEALEDNTSTSTDAGDDDDHNPGTTPPQQPTPAANKQNFAATPPTNNGHTSVPSPVASSFATPPSQWKHHTDKTAIVTRDYYRLAETIGGNHSCLVFITNTSSSTELRDPVIFTRKGYTRIPPDSKVPPDTTTYCGFRKPSLAVRGTCGCISYEYCQRNGRSKRFAVMWKVPYRVVNREENQVAIKWMDVDLSDPIDANTHTSLELYQEMSRGDHISRDVAKNGRSLHIVNLEDEAELDATFSGSCKAIVKVEFCFK